MLPLEFRSIISRKHLVVHLINELYFESVLMFEGAGAGPSSVSSKNYSQKTKFKFTYHLKNVLALLACLSILFCLVCISILCTS